VAVAAAWTVDPLIASWGWLPWAVAAGAASHVALDMLCAPVALGWPLSPRRVGADLMDVGGLAESAAQAGLLVAAAALVIVAEPTAAGLLPPLDRW